MTKDVFKEQLIAEISSGIISDSVFENKPIIDLFDYQKSDPEKNS